MLTGLLLATVLALLSSSGGRAGSSFPVIAAAGDIACDPSSASYDGGRGTASECRQLATARFLVAGRYAAVLTLGDDQYDAGAYPAYLASYDQSWGRVKSITRPAP